MYKNNNTCFQFSNVLNLSFIYFIYFFFGGGWVTLLVSDYNSLALRIVFIKHCTLKVHKTVHENVLLT